MGEWTRERIELHPVLGYEMVKDIIFWKDLAPIILHHHERWDGRGYPGKLEGPAIPLGARIIGASEAFDIITSKYSYKTPLPYDMAIREMEAKAGTQFDPNIVAAIKTQIQEADIQEKKTSPHPTRIEKKQSDSNGQKAVRFAKPLRRARRSDVPIGRNAKAGRKSADGCAVGIGIY